MTINEKNINNNFFINTEYKENYVFNHKKIETIETILFKRKTNPTPEYSGSLKTRKIEHNQDTPRKQLFKNDDEELSNPLISKSSLNESLPFPLISEFEEDMTVDNNQKIVSEDVKNEQFYKEKEPEHWIPITINKAKKIEFTIPKELASIKNIIYIFRNKKNGRLLIGKTETKYSQRMSSYKTAFNSDLTKIPKKITDKNFVTAVKENPTHFELGILYALKTGDVLNQMETNFINFKLAGGHSLYNQRKGGAGGRSRTEEQETTYAIPKDGPFSPKKYYPFHENEEGKIRLLLSPGFYKNVNELKNSRIDEDQGFLYVIKELDTGSKYNGATTQENPEDRINQHLYKAQNHNPHHKNYIPNLKDGVVHPKIGKNPTNYGANVLPVIYDITNIPQEERNNYHISKTLSEAEITAIKLNKALVSQGGFNCNSGGGGPIGESKKKSLLAIKL
ncbi:MAG: hypothetical protein H0V82_08470 [Candidatus Protochlamydia sp.]|nr:hypothetical protein [Candidatus Protochlamydia sp.]